MAKVILLQNTCFPTGSWFHIRDHWTGMRRITFMWHLSSHCRKYCYKILQNTKKLFFSFWKYLPIFLFFLLIGYIYWDKISQTFVNSSALTYGLVILRFACSWGFSLKCVKMQSWGPLPVILLWIWRIEIGYLKKKILPVACEIL